MSTDEVLDRIESNGGPKGLDLKGRDLSHIDLSRDTILTKLKERGYTDRAPAELIKAGESSGWHKLVLKVEEGYLNKPPPPWFSWFTRGIDLTEAQLQHANLSGAQLQNANLWEAQLQDANLWHAQLQGAFLYGAEIEEAHLEDVDWGGGYLLGEERVGLFDLAEAVYRGLKQWYSRRGQSDPAGEFHFREMECRRKRSQGRVRSLWSLGSLRQKRGWGAWKARLKLTFGAPWLWLFDLSCGYGERPSWTLGWLLIAFLLPALAYLFLAGLALKAALFYSAAFLVPLANPLEARDTFPTLPPWVDTVALLQAYAGYFLMALFLVVLVLKMGHR